MSRAPKPDDIPPLTFCGGAVTEYEVTKPRPAVPTPPEAAEPIDCDEVALELAGSVSSRLASSAQHVKPDSSTYVL